MAHDHHHVCPWWLGYLLVNPLRRLIEPPGRLLGPYVRPGMTVVEPGCGMGYFTLPLARMVGPSGRVIAVDLQEKMIRGLVRRARRAGLADRIVPAVSAADDLRLNPFRESADLAVALHMVHEVPDRERFLAQIQESLKPSGRLLVVEPAGHVTPEDFERTLAAAESAGFVRTREAVRARGLAATLRKGEG
jgi:ubiquinone/menaquinone biosynthesis C-methylase UbiE